MTNKTVIITGSGRGIGAATAKLFSKHGYSVCINYKSDQASAAAVAAEITEGGGACIVVQADASTENGVKKLFGEVDKNLGQVSVLVNNAGILQTQSRIENLTATRINKILSNNITGYFLCCREAVKRMSTRHGGEGGTIVNVSSIAARTASPVGYIDYAASKGAIDTLTRGLALEVATENIRVNGVRPGLIYTDMLADAGKQLRVDHLAHSLPMKRCGHPNEVAEAIYWLASEKSSYSTGTFIDMAGGL